KGEADALSLD
nr:Chain B, 10-mer peptide [synthetic construct]3PTL_B Chain B, 10-mer peptide from Lactoferrin [synthetic construct]